MTWRALAVVPLVAVAVALLGSGLSRWLAVVVGLVAGLVAAAALAALQRRRIRELAVQVEAEPLDVAAPADAGVPDAAAGPFAPLEAALTRLRAQAATRAAQAQGNSAWRRSLVDSISGPALVFSASDRLAAANHAARRLLRIPDRGPHLTLIQALGSAALVGAVRESRRAGGTVQVEAEVHDRDLRATASLIDNDVLLMISDRTEQRRVEELRRDFVLNASHELKTPATAITTLTEALAVSLERNPDKAPALVERLGEEAERLVRMVHDLLDLRRLEEPGPLERVAVDLAAIAREATADVVPRADAEGITLDVDVPDQAFVSGVARDLRLVLDNLIGNAVEYNHDGGSVAVRVRPRNGVYEVEVSDTGIGIPQQELHRIFERFYRVDVRRVREREGTGLGLSIVRHAVQRHGGSIRVESLLGEGSTFWVRLPIEAGDRRV